MAEHLEKPKIKQYIKDFCEGLISDDRQFDPVDDAILLCQMIDFAPAADVVGVKHGHWLPMGMCIKCSECGLTIYIGSYSKRTLEHHGNAKKYCEKCGARMDGANEK